MVRRKKKLGRGGDAPMGSDQVVDRMGFASNQLVLEVGLQPDCDEELRGAVKNKTGTEFVEGSATEVVDSVLLWWRDGDGDLVDELVEDQFKLEVQLEKVNGVIDSLKEMIDGITDFISDPQVLKIINDNLENIVKYSGIHHNDTYEIKTNFNKADCETVISSRNNSYIVLGRDRDGGIASGKGGTGGTGCGSIDLIAGLAGPTPIDTVFGQEILTDKSFKNDAARIYISQRSSVDFQFEIPIFLTKLGAGGVNLDNSDDKSAVALKADCVRVIARENIKLVTFHKGLNSQNKKSKVMKTENQNRKPKTQQGKADANQS